MLLKWNGHSCFSLTFSDGTTLVTDPFDDHVGYPLCEARADAALVSHGHGDHSYVQALKGEPKVFTEPGKYAFRGLKITGVPSFHDDAQGAKRGKNTIFVVEGEGLKIAHLGDLGHPLNGEQLRALQNLDLLLIPIGGFYTIDTPTAVAQIEALKPRCAVAMHFSNDFCPFPISDESEFVRLTKAERVGNAIEVLPGTTLPSAVVMEYKK